MNNNMPDSRKFAISRQLRTIVAGFQKNKQDPTTTADAFETGLDGWLDSLSILSARSSGNGEFAIIFKGEKGFKVGSHDIKVVASAYLADVNGPTDEDIETIGVDNPEDERTSICLNLHASVGADWEDDYRVVIPISQVNGVKVKYHQYKTVKGYNAVFIQFEQQEEQKEEDLLKQLVSILKAEWEELLSSDKVGEMIFKDVIEHVK